ncbi:MAG: Hpt domain-containing protein, partial [Alphaproteobacteria bacterium]|nr:Hpt domain-containing protein [Alphaproteobacteria bacterium]
TEADLLYAIETYQPQNKPLLYQQKGPDLPIEPSTSPTPALSVDQDTLQRLKATFGDEFFGASVAIFSEEIDNRLSVLERAIAGSEDARREAHAIKGSAASYGLLSLSQVAARLEQNPNELASCLEQLKHHWDHAKPIMDALC